MLIKDYVYFQSLFTSPTLSNQGLQAIVEKISLRAFDKAFVHQAIFNSRLRTTGGRYHLKDHHIDVNPIVFQKYGWEELVNVILHELCHYHLHLANKGYQHRDVAFKTLLKNVGGTRYVKPLVDEHEAKFVYQCQSCQTLIPRTRRLDVSRYRCKCQGVLKQIKTSSRLV